MALAEYRWIRLATTPLPVPDSPKIKTVESTWLTLRAWRRAWIKIGTSGNNLPRFQFGNLHLLHPALDLVVFGQLGFEFFAQGIDFGDVALIDHHPYQFSGRIEDRIAGQHQFSARACMLQNVFPLAALHHFECDRGVDIAFIDEFIDVASDDIRGAQHVEPLGGGIDAQDGAVAVADEQAVIARRDDGIQFLAQFLVGEHPAGGFFQFSAVFEYTKHADDDVFEDHGCQTCQVGNLPGLEWQSAQITPILKDLAGMRPEIRQRIGQQAAGKQSQGLLHPVVGNDHRSQRIQHENGVCGSVEQGFGKQSPIAGDLVIAPARKQQGAQLRTMAG